MSSPRFEAASCNVCAAASKEELSQRSGSNGHVDEIFKENMDKTVELITCLIECTIPKTTELKTEERLASCLWTSGLKGPPGNISDVFEMLHP